MSEPLYAEPIANVPQGSSPPPFNDRRGLSQAEWMLLLATVVWGSSFALAKGAGEAINAAADVEKHALGPMMVLALRFTLGAIAWFAIVPPARVGWKRSSVSGGIVLGSFLALGLILQHIALDRTPEAVAAFLTSLTIIFVPLIMKLVFGQAIPAAAWVGIAFAFPGVWLMSDAGTFALGLGEWLGLASAFVFAWHLPMLNRYAVKDTPWRMCGAQFAVVAIGCWIWTAIILSQMETFDWSVLLTQDVWLSLVLLVAGPTLVSFGLANVYQPRVSPVRAVLIYLLEPIFAAAFAWLWAGSKMTAGMIAGGGLILAANAVVELWPRKSESEPARPATSE